MSKKRLDKLVSRELGDATRGLGNRTGTKRLDKLFSGTRTMDHLKGELARRKLKGPTGDSYDARIVDAQLIDMESKRLKGKRK